MKTCETCKYLKRYTWWKFWQKPRMCTFFEPALYRSAAETYEQYCGPKKYYWIKKK